MAIGTLRGYLHRRVALPSRLAEMIRAIRSRWSAEGGYREFLLIAVPLILSTASWSVQHFVDRVFLTWHSTEALTAALPGGLTNFVLVSLFIGIVSYINTFVAQYIGAGHPEKVGPSLWQGAYLAVFSAGIGLVAATWANAIFDLVGHDESIRHFEADYFRILCYGIFPIVLSTSFACFFSGRGHTWSVFWVNVSATGFNIVLDYGLIFGAGGLPAMGIRGAAWATNIASALGAGLYLVLLARPRYRREFATYRGWRFDPDLFRRLLHFGGPSGINFMLDILAFTSVVLIVGRLGTMELTAANLAFNINSLAFMPLIGASIAVSTMVGQRLGRDDTAGAEYSTWTGFHIGLTYMVGMALAYAVVPQIFLLPYSASASGPEFEAARELAMDLLRFVAFYCVFDAAYMMFTAALKGAGDTNYIMWVSVLISFSVAVIPSYIAVTWFDTTAYVLFAFITLWLVVAAIVFYLRFLSGHWKSMRVIEQQPVMAANEAAS
ncbi:MAG: MATE family efflux transporter [Candidatus Latescibacterota bacterium]|nr:MATE family efflux transporter [Candidatus Latescibacterota bacterium]